jgi:iron(III) transport system substrate-binding protein
MINTDLIGDIEVKGYKDLLDPRLKGRIAFASPERSSSSFEHLVNMLYAMGEGDPENGFEYVKAFCENLDGVLLSSSSEVYEGVANGKYTVGLTFEEAAVTMLKSDKHISIVYMEEGVVFTPDGICISKLSERKPEARAFVDFMTSKNAQRFITANLGRRSVRTDIVESGIIAPYDSIKRIEVNKDRVITSKDGWIARFCEIFKRGEP